MASCSGARSAWAIIIIIVIMAESRVRNGAQAQGLPRGQREGAEEAPGKQITTGPHALRSKPSKLALVVAATAYASQRETLSAAEVRMLVGHWV